MTKRKLFALLAASAIAAVVAPPALFLANVWRHDGAVPLAPPAVGADDAGQMNTRRGARVVPVPSDPAEAERQLSALVRQTAAAGGHISISGAHHSMGGHTIYPDGLVLDMLPFNRMSLDPERRILTVGAGARWSEIVPFLDERGFAVSVMQTNNDFSVGGSISVNCHGWQNDSQPICSTVESFRLLTPSGEIVRCSRTENQELFPSRSAATDFSASSCRSISAWWPTSITSRSRTS